MADIRSFFGQKQDKSSNATRTNRSNSSQMKAYPETHSKISKSRGRQRVILDDDEDDDVYETQETKLSQQKSKKPKIPEPVKFIDPSTYFSGSENTIHNPRTSGNADKSHRHSAKSENVPPSSEDVVKIDNDKESIDQSNTTMSPRKRGNYDSMDGQKSTGTRRRTNTASPRKKEMSSPRKVTSPSRAPSPTKSTSPRKVTSSSKATSPRKTVSTIRNHVNIGKGTFDDVKTGGSDNMPLALTVLQNCPLVEVQDPEGLSDVSTKSGGRNFAFADRTPAAHGSKMIPEGKENCLATLSFVCTGVLESLDRDEVQGLIKKYGGKLTGAPSSRTTFVVLGSDAGPKKLNKIREHKIKTINEDGLFYLIENMPANGGDTKAAQDAMQKKRQEEEKIVSAAKEMEPKLENEKIKQQKQLWTVKYAPQSLKDLCGNKSAIQKLQSFLENWDKHLNAGFKKPGSDGMGVFKAVLVSGPPGIGKTTSAHLLAKTMGYDILEMNASDTRNKQLMDASLQGVTDNSSIVGFFKGTHFPDSDSLSPNSGRKLVLIMDEVDGMSAGDRGGIGQLNQIIKKTQIPIICICNDRSSQKLRPLDRTTFDIRFIRPQVSMLRARLMTIAFREGLKLTPGAIEQLVQSTHSDIRQIINILSSWKLSQSEMNDESSKKVGKDSEKFVILKPWEICSRFLNGSLFDPKVYFNDKIELYFNDHELSYLMVQENYLKTIPMQCRNATNQNKQNVLRVDLIAKAAESISDADLIDAQIHGPQQQWSLMPLHAVFSCVRPSFFVAGQATGQFQFTSWLGNNSKQSKMARLLRDLQSHLRLKVTGNRNEVRQNYLPFFAEDLIGRLVTDGSAAIDAVIERMDDYFVSREDLDSLEELSLTLGAGKQMKSIATATKTAFSRKFNSMTHPIPFHPPTAMAAGKKKAAQSSEIPDLEEAMDVVMDSDIDDGDTTSGNDNSKDDQDALMQDRLVSVGGEKGKRKASSSTKAKASSSKKRR